LWNEPNNRQYDRQYGIHSFFGFLSYDDPFLVNGVTPDYEVSDDLLTENDEILDYALRLIKEL
jgi:hypothetical protein